MVNCRYPDHASSRSCSLDSQLQTQGSARTVSKVSSLFHLVILSTALSAVVTGCSHLDPYENVSNVSPRDETRSLLPKLKTITATEEKQLAFVGTLPGALEDVDKLRLALIQTSSEMSGEYALYNAALWTLTPVMLYRAATSTGLGTSAKNDVIGMAAILGAGYGFLSSRPKREKSYAQGAKQLTCLMVDYTRFLYTKEEFQVEDSQNSQNSQKKSVPQIAVELEKAISAYETASIQYMQSILQSKRLKQGSRCATDGADCQRREAALNVGAPDPLTQIQDITNQQLDDARSKFLELRSLVGNVQYRAGLSLRAESRQIMSDLSAEIQSDRELTKISGAITTIGESIDALQAKMAKAQSSMAKKVREPRLPALLPSLNLGKDEDKKMFLAEIQLLTLLADTKIILEAHKRKTEEAKALKKAMGCETPSTNPADNKPAAAAKTAPAEQQLPTGP